MSHLLTVLQPGLARAISVAAAQALARLEAAGATLVEVELPCVGEVDRQAILPTELLDFLGEPSISVSDSYELHVPYLAEAMAMHLLVLILASVDGVLGLGLGMDLLHCIIVG